MQPLYSTFPEARNGGIHTSSHWSGFLGLPTGDINRADVPAQVKARLRPFTPSPVTLPPPVSHPAKMASSAWSFRPKTSDTRKRPLDRLVFARAIKESRGCSSVHYGMSREINHISRGGALPQQHLGSLRSQVDFPSPWRPIKVCYVKKISRCLLKEVTVLNPCQHGAAAPG